MLAVDWQFFLAPNLEVATGTGRYNHSKESEL